MIPFCTDTVTLYHYAGKDTWTRYVLSGVRWRHGAAANSSQSAEGRIERAAQTRVIIPAAVLDGIPVDIGGKDYMLPGDGPYITRNYTPADLKREYPQMGTVKSVEDHTGAPHLKHWKVVLA